MRVIDYRATEEIPEACSECGAPIIRELTFGRIHVSEADLLHAPYFWDQGIETPGPALTIWWTWWCSAKRAEHPSGPVLIGASG